MKQLVLVGGGHAHALVLRAWARRPPPGARLLLVCPQRQAAYSGMVPGWLAGHWGFNDLCIDVAALAQAAGAEWLPTQVQALDAGARQLQLADGRVLDYDLLSLNIGSTLRPPPVAPAGRLLSLRPLDGLQAAWDGLLQDPWLLHDPAPLAITMAGGGPAAVESVLAVCHRLRRLVPQRTLLPRLITHSPRLLPSLNPRAAALADAALQQAGVQVQCGLDARRAVAMPARAPGLLLWATGAESHDWPRHSGLACNEAGFVQVDEQLRSRSHPEVFAVGDAAEFGAGLPKSGVVAVRQGPVLADNLRAALQGRPGRPYRPQAQQLALLATGGRHAIGARGERAAEGAWLWHWKRWIDRRFIAKLSV